jgi:hypothetical protein
MALIETYQVETTQGICRIAIKEAATNDLLVAEVTGLPLWDGPVQTRRLGGNRRKENAIRELLADSLRVINGKLGCVIKAYPLAYR